jgi:hypothetical protein
MILRYSERLRSNVVVVGADEYPSYEEVLSQAQMHSATRACCGGRVKMCVAFDKASGPGREQFMQRDGLQRFLRQRERRR